MKTPTELFFENFFFLETCVAKKKRVDDALLTQKNVLLQNHTAHLVRNEADCAEEVDRVRSMLMASTPATWSAYQVFQQQCDATIAQASVPFLAKKKQIETDYDDQLRALDTAYHQELMQLIENAKSLAKTLYTEAMVYAKKQFCEDFEAFYFDDALSPTIRTYDYHRLKSIAISIGFDTLSPCLFTACGTPNDRDYAPFDVMVSYIHVEALLRSKDPAFMDIFCSVHPENVMVFQEIQRQKSMNFEFLHRDINKVPGFPEHVIHAMHCWNTMHARSHGYHYLAFTKAMYWSAFSALPTPANYCPIKLDPERGFNTADEKLYREKIDQLTEVYLQTKAAAKSTLEKTLLKIKSLEISTQDLTTIAAHASSTSPHEPEIDSTEPQKTPMEVSNQHLFFSGAEDDEELSIYHLAKSLGSAPQPPSFFK